MTTARATTTNAVYFLWSRADDRVQGPFPPLGPEDPASGENCIACMQPLADGTDIGLIVIGATTTPDQGKLYNGDKFSALGLIAHARCLTGRATGP